MLADLALLNGTVHTLAAPSRLATAVAIVGGRILAVGADAKIRDVCGAQTQSLDLRGRTVIPGLIDGHAHMDREGLKGLLPSLAGVKSIDALVARLREIV